MSIGSLSNIASGYVQSLVGNILANQSTGNTTSSSASPVSQTADINQLSPFAEMLSTLQQLQQSNPTQYQQVTQQIATNLTTAANTATANGNTTAATIPLGMKDAIEEGRLKKGDLIMLVSVGAGYTVGGVLIRWAY